MKRLEQKKLLTVIAASQLEQPVVEVLRRCGAGGYTVVQASGAGASGIQSGMLDADSNVLIYVILSEARLVTVLDELEQMMRRGHRLKAIVSDISILPRKSLASARNAPDD